MTWKVKTDTNALPFNGRNRLLSIQYPFEMDHVKRFNAFLIRLKTSSNRLTIWAKRLSGFLIRLF